MQSEGQEQVRRARSLSHPSTAADEYTDESERILISGAISHNRENLRIDTPYQNYGDELDDKEETPDNKPLARVTGKASSQSLNPASHNSRNGLAPEKKAVGTLDHVVVSRDMSPWSSVTPSPVSSEYPLPTARPRRPKLAARDDRRTASRGLTDPTSNGLLPEEDYSRHDRPRAF